VIVGLRGWIVVLVLLVVREIKKPLSLCGSSRGLRVTVRYQLRLLGHALGNDDADGNG
jgi:hypothetical protein